MTIRSPFDRPGDRVFLLTGLADDLMAHPDARLCQQDIFLWEHLRAVGFERIVFVSHHDVYFLDEASHGSAMNPPGHSPVSPPAAALSLDLAPGGLTLRSLRRVRGASPTPPTEAPRYRGLQDSTELTLFVRRILTEGSPRTALVFYELSHLLTQAGTRDRTYFRGVVLSDFLANAPPNSRACLIFRVPGISSLEVARFLDSIDFGWLYGIDASGREVGCARRVTLGSPGADEVSAVVDRARLIRGLAVDWNRREQLEVEVTAYARSAARTLRTVDDWLASVSRFDDQTVGQLTGRAAGRSAWDDLDALVGLAEVKAFFAGQRRAAETLRPSLPSRPPRPPAFPLRLCPDEPRAVLQNLHMVLQGNPGTGKTTVARLIGALYRDIGLLATGHVVAVTRVDLVAEYVGQSAPRTRDAVERAMGGVLFIDEAYSLCTGPDDNFGQESLTTLLEAMSTHAGRFAVVVAGYPDRMTEFLHRNEGLPRRFAHTLTLPDLDADSLQRVFGRVVSRHPGEMSISKELEAALPRFFSALHGTRDRHFGNAGDATGVAEAAIARALARGSRALVVADLPVDKQILLDVPVQGAGGVLQSLDALVGLRTVKDRVRGLFDRLAVDRRRKPKATLSPGHYCFVGNPGTGKTHVARLMAEQLYALGLTEHRRLTSATAAELIGSYLGQTEERTRDFLQSGLGGVIFIDEAHQLASDPGRPDHSFGAQAVRVLVPFAEDNRHRCSIILAGYPGPMDALMAADPGLSGRFASQIVFEDYSDSEMVEIFLSFCAVDHFAPEQALLDALQPFFALQRRTLGAQFANARTARKALEDCLIRQATRLAALPDATSEALHTLILEDLPMVTP